MSREVVYRLHGIKKLFPVYGGVLRRTIGHVRALDDISLDVYRGETISIIGESGCGKTTLGRVLALLLEPSSGERSFNFNNGLEELKPSKAKLELRFRKKVQMIFQDPYTSFNPRQRVGVAIEEVLQVHGFSEPQEREERIKRAVEMVNIREDMLDRYPHEFSGGQRQRLSIARCLAGNPELIIADEIVSALDVSIQAQVLNLLKEIQKSTQLSLVFITHDVAVARYMADRIVVMYLGSIVEILPARLLPKIADHPYTIALISAVPTMNKSEKTFNIKLSGELPSPIDLPQGCSFSSRCPFVMDICRSEKPILKMGSSLNPDHQVACHLTNPPQSVEEGSHE